MRLAVICCKFALCALLIPIFASDIFVAGDDNLSDEIVDLSEFEDSFLMKLINKMNDEFDPKSWRDAETKFQEKLNAQARGFNTPRTAYQLAKYASKESVTPFPKKILRDLKTNADKDPGYVYERKTIADSLKNATKSMKKQVDSMKKTTNSFRNKASKLASSVFKKGSGKGKDGKKGKEEGKEEE